MGPRRASVAKIVIGGGTPLRGTVGIGGSKNAALPCLIATLLTDRPCVVRNVPELDDISTVCDLLGHLGKRVERSGTTVRILASPGGLRPEAPYDLVKRMRASVLVAGPLLARLGRARVSLPGGCAIGSRPINLHLDGFRALGASVRLRRGTVELTAPKLVGGRILHEPSSVGATENLMMAASLARGRTVIENAAREPEVVDLADALTGMGVRIQGAGTSTVEVEGGRRLGGMRHTVIPDRIEAGTYLLAGAITGGRVRVTGVRAAHLAAVLENLRAAGVAVRTGGARGSGWVEVSTPRAGFRAVGIETRPYPGFPTDMQAQWMALMAVTPGRSVIRETVFENRFLHVGELLRMGANIRVRGHDAVVTGVKILEGAPVMATDLRASVALILAGLAARGETVVDRVYHLDRGYSHLEDRLRRLGAHIRRIRA